MDYLNAQLQGQQAAAQRFSQGATYTTNLTEKERKNMDTWTEGGSGGTTQTYKNPYSTMTSTNSSYNMPSTNTRTMTSVMTQKKPRTQTTTQGGY